MAAERPPPGGRSSAPDAQLWDARPAIPWPYWAKLCARRAVVIALE
jgi:hypothetical protein